MNKIANATGNKEAMTLLEKHFDSALETPDGVKKLRALILSLAVQGNLTKDREQKSIILGDIIELISGQHLLANEQNEVGKGIPYLTGPSDFGEKYPTATRWTETPKVVAEPGDILLTVKGAGVGKTNRLLSEKTAISRQLMAVRAKGADADFVHLILRNATDHFQSTMTGIAIPGIGRKDVLSLKAKLPSFTEQKRIVAKINDLMTLCDKLESQRNERSTKRLTIHTAAINKLLSAPDKSEFNSSWNFITKNFNELYSVKENVEELKKAILQLAVMGKLVKQDPKDQPASELLKEIEAEKKRLVREGKIRNQEALPPIAEDKLSFELPPGWVGVRLGNISLINGGFAFKSSQYVQDGVRVIRISDFDEKGFKNERVVRYTFSELLSDYLVEENNILMAMTGGTVGKSYLVRVLPEKMVVNQRVATMKLLKHIAPEYINALIQTSLIQNVIQNAKNSTNDNISMGDIKNFFVPLPPLAEQNKIVAKIDELMSLCNTLAMQINTSTDKQTAILDAVLAKI